MLSQAIQRIYTLGPKGTFSNLAASMVLGAGTQEIHFTTTLAQIPLEVEKDPLSLGVIPIENSSSGTVGPAQDSLIESEVQIIGELSVSISYHLVAQVPLHEVERFYCHSVAFNQCGRFLAKSMPQAEVIFSNSNAHSGELFLENQGKTAAIIPSSIALEDARFAGLSKAEQIEDSAENTTRFVILQQRTPGLSFDFEKEKTSIYVELHEDRHSLLFEILREFHVFGVNLCRLESRPSRTRRWQYGFYIDFYNNHRTQACLNALKGLNIEFRILGSYSKLSSKNQP